MNLGAIMTMPIRIDTLKYAQLLKESGLSAEQAELQAEALGTVLNECHVAVESDLVIQRSDLLARMDVLQQELHDRMDLLKQEVFDRMDLLKQEVFDRMDLLTQEIYGKMDLLKQEIYSRIDALELRVEALERRLEALERRLEALERRIAGFETRFYWLFGIQFVVDAVILFKLFA
jgi:chaperonin cofactor prefoldin